MNPDICACSSCGFQWKRGFDGSHDCAVILQKTVKRLESDCRRLRTLLAFSYGGTSIYADDGELQDSRSLPLIDFLRDSPELIELKMLQRGMEAMNKDHENS